MISYAPFYQTLMRKNITEYQLIYKEGISDEARLADYDENAGHTVLYPRLRGFGGFVSRQKQVMLLGCCMSRNAFSSRSSNTV